MAFQVSPGVNVSEIDLTTVVPAVSTSIGAIAGHFRWGPVDKRVLVSQETALVAHSRNLTQILRKTSSQQLTSSHMQMHYRSFVL